FPSSERHLSKDNLGRNRPFTWVGSEGDCLLSFPAPGCALEIYGLKFSFSSPAPLPELLIPFSFVNNCKQRLVIQIAPKILVDEQIMTIPELLSKACSMWSNQ